MGFKKLAAMSMIVPIADCACRARLRFAQETLAAPGEKCGLACLAVAGARLTARSGVLSPLFKMQPKDQHLARPSL